MRLYTDIDPFCCEVLRARVADGGLPPGEVWERDIKTLTAEELKPFTQIHLFAGIGGSPLGLKWAGWPDEWSIVTGGFPCQDISSAGRKVGIDGEQSSLFFEAAMVIAAVRPDWALIENVGALSGRGLERVCGAMGKNGYAVEALRVGSWAVGAEHLRERWWLVAHPNDGREPVLAFNGEERIWMPPGHSRKTRSILEPDLGGVDDGIPNRMDRIRALGNSQDPRVVEVIARAMIAAHGSLTEAAADNSGDAKP